MAPSTLYRHLPRARTAALEARAGARHADQARAALLLPDRLAADQPLGAVRARQGLLRGLWAAARRRWCAIWAMAAGGTRCARPGVTAAAARSPRLPRPRSAEPTTKVVLAAAHLDHDPAHCGRRHRNVKALCQRCHLLHDRPEHRRRIRLTLRRRRALGDLFSGYQTPADAEPPVIQHSRPSRAGALSCGCLEIPVLGKCSTWPFTTGWRERCGACCVPHPHSSRWLRYGWTAQVVMVRSRVRWLAGLIGALVAGLCVGLLQFKVQQENLQPTLLLKFASVALIGLGFGLPWLLFNWAAPADIGAREPRPMSAAAGDDGDRQRVAGSGLALTVGPRPPRQAASSPRCAAHAAMGSTTCGVSRREPVRTITFLTQKMRFR